jgi:hypothetical protein
VYVGNVSTYRLFNDGVSWPEYTRRWWDVDGREGGLIWWTCMEGLEDSHEIVSQESLFPTEFLAGALTEHL